MPELPDITVYIEAMERRILGQPLERIRIHTPFLLRSTQPPPSVAENQKVIALRRIGKRIAIGVEGDIWLVIHLMIAGRLHWKKRGVALSRRNDLLALDFPNGTLTLTEAGTQRRASLTMAQGEAGLKALDPGGLEVMTCTLAEFAGALRRENHTLKRSLTDPHLLSGIGNAYSDEILHAARLSPVAMTSKLTDEEIERLFAATRATIEHWCEDLRRETGDGFPEGVTAFREGMAAHGRYGLPCPVCGEKIQRIRHAANETNYCVRCQTGGKLLADRALSRLLGSDWPRSLEEMELRLKS